MSAAAVPLVVVMGVSGSGKTTIGRLLARKLNAEFLEGDELHPQRNIERMEAGIALTDNDRRDWLLEIAQQLADARASRHHLIVSCAALRRSHRDLLRTASSGIVFVHLQGDASLLEERLLARPPRLIPASPIAIQLQTLEPPGADERAATFDAALSPEQIASKAADWISTRKPVSARRP